MPCPKPTGGPGPVALTISRGDRTFLRSVFRMAHSGIRDELAKYPESLREPARLHREEAVYDGLLAALDNGFLVVTGDLCCVLSDLAETIDRANEYERVVAEHAALLGLRKQTCEGARDERRR